MFIFHSTKSQNCDTDQGKDNSKSPCAGDRCVQTHNLLEPITKLKEEKGLEL